MKPFQALQPGKTWKILIIYNLSQFIPELKQSRQVRLVPAWYQAYLATH